MMPGRPTHGFPPNKSCDGRLGPADVGSLGATGTATDGRLGAASIGTDDEFRAKRSGMTDGCVAGIRFGEAAEVAANWSAAGNAPTAAPDRVSTTRGTSDHGRSTTTRQSDRRLNSTTGIGPGPFRQVPMQVRRCFGRHVHAAQYLPGLSHRLSKCIRRDDFRQPIAIRCIRLAEVNICGDGNGHIPTRVPAGAGTSIIHHRTQTQPHLLPTST